QLTDDAQAKAMLTSQADLLLTWDAGNLLQQLLEAAAERGEESLHARWQTRYAQWQSARQAQAGTPQRRVAKEGPNWQAESQPQTWIERTDQQAVTAERSNSYTVITANNSAIGDNALVINNIGRIPLRWKRPTEGRPRRAAAAVGREVELVELHQRLLAGQSAAVVSRGTSTALRGQPAIGKTTLAAMYVDRYGQDYPGGTLWLEVGPDRRDAASVEPILQRIAAYAYDADAQVQMMLENSMFAAERVKSLLSGHGAMLVVIDDVWDEAALKEIQDALPDDSFLILTTRDFQVAYALNNSADKIQHLDVLSPEDARMLLQRGAPGLDDLLADRVASGLGFHAQALVLAAGALHFRGVRRHEKTAKEILDRVAAGRGFGDLPRMDKAARMNAVEAALKYSYDYLGEEEEGKKWQTQFRALGCFAQEADFDLEAAAFVWSIDVELAEEFMLLLNGLSLIEETSISNGENRWQQHAILRAYALSLQSAEERLLFPERHTDYYIKLAQFCLDCKPRDYDRIEQEFGQLQHAFNWCEKQSPQRTIQLSLLLNDFMRIRGRVSILNQWLKVSLRSAENSGNRLGKANTLQSLGDLESRLGNIEQARAHYDA
ncbi:MAG: hypothetical protein D6711_12970, partial [Chloroflexi bacterium]